MSDKLGTLTTPEEYVNYYYEGFKQQLQSKNLQISKVGFLGFLLHTLGFTQFDIKTYYDSLFREAFLSTANISENLKLHASIYNYNIISSTPANITGELVLMLSALPPSINVSSREILIQNLKININNIIYTLDSTYSIVDTFCKIQKSTGEIYYLPFDPLNGSIPIMEFFQYDNETFNFKIPYYSYGTYFQKILELKRADSVIYQILISIKTKNSLVFESFTISTLKHLSNSLDKTVFIEQKESKIIVEFGSGIYGLYIPESEVKIEIKVTVGSLGNILQNIVTPYDGIVKVYDRTDKTTVYNVKPNDIIKVKIQYASGGTDILTNEDLRLNIIDYIQTRDNLISETDYQVIIKQYISDFVLMFKKTHLIDNCIYCFILIRDLYQTPLVTKSISITHAIFNPNSLTVIYKPIFTIDNISYISPFIYIFDDQLLEYPGYIYFEEYNIYFSKILTIDETTIINQPPLSLYISYSLSNKYTKFIVKSYQVISMFQLYITIPQYNIFHECMYCYDDNAHVYTLNTIYDGIILDCIDVEIQINYNSVYTFNYKHSNICVCYDISKLLTLKIFKIITSTPSVFLGGGPRTIIDDIDIVMNIPVMLLNIYELKQQEYNNRLLDILANMSITKNRMISDTLQFRFLNTEIIPANIVKALTIDHDFEITLPFKLIITITGNKKYFTENNLNSITAIEELKLNIAQILFSNYSGIAVSFYQSKIIDIIHSVIWVKFCEVKVTDSNINPKTIPNSNFELIDQNSAISKLSKLDSANFCPIYVYWDVDDISITVDFE
jgi:hypothetical protein